MYCCWSGCGSTQLVVGLTGTSPCHEWGRWHLEAGIGKCAAPYAPVLKTPEKAGAWIEKSGTIEAGWRNAQNRELSGRTRSNSRRDLVSASQTGSLLRRSGDQS